MDEEDNKKIFEVDNREIDLDDELPLLPIRNHVLFPGSVAPFDVGREKSVALVEDLEGQSQPVIVIFAQRDPATDDPGLEDLHTVGVAARVLKALRHSTGNYSLILQGLARVRLERLTQDDPYLKARVSRMEEPRQDDVETEALAMSLRDTAKQVIQLMPELPREAGSLIDSINEPGQLADLVAANLEAPVDEKASLLESVDVKDRIRKVLRLLTRQLEVLKMRERINSQIKEEMGKNQREYVLRQQLKAIKEELGEEEGDQSDLDLLEERLNKANLAKEAENVCRKQLKRLRSMQVGSAEYTVVRTYIDWILDIPWSKSTTDMMDIAEVRKVLDEDHSGLEKIKKRIVEYLAVRKLKKDKKGPILCLIGPPGVGKTSLGRSIARALGRKFVRISLGGVHDEAAIRGHRRTYVGALPGQIIQGMKKAGTVNPVFMLDEIDKIGHDFRGDPAAALLEVLDPEQNRSFNDHYLDLDYDLSDVMFITTANSMSGIPAPLADRMEIISLSGYTEFEKLNIAVRYLIPRQREEAGLQEVDLEITENAIRAVVHHYTKESGVRNLERELGSICRKVARKVVNTDKKEKYRIVAKSIPKYLGVPKYRPESARGKDEIGLTNGLAYTNYGGAILECEVAVVPGKGKLVITGLLEKGMQESAQAAMSYIRSREKLLGLPSDFYQNSDFHIHFPEFVPKDGPSAGVTMATSIASALMRIPVRRDLAMTGEITLRGRIMPIGGLKEKALAAHRAGIRTLLIPKDNRKDLREIPRRVLSATRIVLIEHADEALREALCLSDPEAMFGRRVAPMEYVNGRLITHGQPVPAGDATEGGVPAPTVDAPGAQQ